MSKIKKLAAGLMAMLVALVVAVPAFADDSYTITISNSVTGSTYTAYKIFDATYATDDDGATTSTTYYIASNSEWLSAVQASGLFTLSSTVDSQGRYQVTVNDNVTVSQIATWAGNNISGKTEAATDTGDGSTLVLNVKEPGYYYITTTTGSVVTLDTANPTATVIDKNQTPGGDLDKTVDDAKAQIGDTVTYTITSNVPAYDGETKITNYTFKDTLSDGLTAPDASDVTVQILNSKKEVVATLTGVVSVSGQVITVSYDPTAITNYPADATIKITYTATVNAEAAYANGNTVNQTWTGDSDGTTDTEIVYTYGFKLVKVIKNTETELDGAKFKLYTSATGGDALTFSYDEETDTYTVDPNGEVTEIEVGSAYIFGLDSVTYYLEETQAPDGYNALTERQSVTVSTTGTTVSDDGVMTISQIEKVENGAGSILPGTGGMGTTVLYVVGGALVICAVVLLVTKRRMGSEN